MTPGSRCRPYGQAWVPPSRLVKSLSMPSSRDHTSGVPQERRLVTVLFADMVGSTTLTVSNDAEVVRERLSFLFERARGVLEAHGATVEKFIGDAVMAVFGVPRGHEDDAERAVRAAYALLATFAADAEGPIQRVELRIGINTGEVATGAGGGDQFLATGQAV